jgi:hypothetical protein
LHVADFLSFEFGHTLKCMSLYESLSISTINGMIMRARKTLIFKLNYFFNLLLIGFISLGLYVSYPLAVYADNSLVSDALNQAMTSMDAAMSSISMTGNPDVDFAVMMIAHHQGAIDMAKVELRYGTDARLRRLAQEIIVTQQSEISLMQLTLERPLSAQSSSSS